MKKDSSFSFLVVFLASGLFLGCSSSYYLALLVSIYKDLTASTNSFASLYYFTNSSALNQSLSFLSISCCISSISSLSSILLLIASSAALCAFSVSLSTSLTYLLNRSQSSSNFMRASMIFSYSIVIYSFSLMVSSCFASIAI